MKTLWHFLRWKAGIAAAETQTTAAERSCLARWVGKQSRVVEIGVWHGVTTARLLEAMPPEGVLFAVDPYPAGRLGVSVPELIARRTVAPVSRGRVHWLRETGAAAGRRFSKRAELPVDFVFIDGDHSYEGICADWEAWSPLVRMGGVIALHDSCSSEARNIDMAGSVRFTNEVILKDTRFRVEECVDSLTILTRHE